jgi:Xaa-Pro aminopeptidase
MVMVMEGLDEAIRSSGANAYVLYASSADANMRYLTRFAAGDPFIFFKQTGARGRIVVSQMEYARAVKESSVDVMTRAEAGYLEYVKEEENPWRALARTIAGLVKGDVLVPASFPFGLARELESFCRVIIDRGTVESLRAVKTHEEILHIEQAQRAAELAVDRAICIIRSATPRKGVLYYDDAPLTSERLRRTMHALLLEQGCRATDTIISCGSESALPHRKGEGPLLEGEPIVIDLFPEDESSGYFADMSRTVVKGEADGRIIEMYEAVREAKELGISLIRPGVSGAEVHQRVVDYFKERGYESGSEGFMHNLGHGVGLEVHELPTVGPGGKPLAVGNVITVEPGLYYRDIGGVRLEDMGAVVSGGFDRLTNYQEELLI